MAGRKVFSIVAAAVLLLPASLSADESDPPPPEKWVTVRNVSAEYTYIRGQRCSCGGGYEVQGQSTGKLNDRHYDQLDCKCRLCGKRRAFFFDVTGIFAEYELARSDEAKLKVFADLNRRFPKLSPESLPELRGLLQDDNPHVRAWAIGKIAKLNTPAARECLLDGYLQAGLLRSFEFDPALRAVGADLLPLIERRFEDPENAASFALTSLLEEIRLPQSARLAERELRREMKKEDGARRSCYITLGALGFKQSEELLLEAYESERADPDESLIWALGRCGGEKSLPIVRQAFHSKQPRVRLSAVVALGAIGDQAAIPDLMKLVADGDGGDLRGKHNLVHNAIYALGLLRAKEAIPLLIQNLRAKPNCDYHYSPIGIYDSHDPDEWTYAGDYINVSIHALTRMGVRKTLPDFQRMLADDRYYLNFDEVANAAANLNLREAVPAIIDRLAKDYQRNVELFGKEQERYSPALRTLTGQPFGEDPKAWQEWLANQTGSTGATKE